jgi:hypothetical protein
LLAVFAAGAVDACNTVTSTGLGNTAGPEPACPASLDAVSSATCTAEGQACSYLYPCVTIPASATCVCSGGHFECHSPDGGSLDDASCPVLKTTEVCPASERSADGLFCSELGLICYYPSACASVPAYDPCQCVGGRTDAEGPHFECSVSCEGPSDANTGGGPADSEPSGPSDGASTSAPETGPGAPADGAADTGTDL